MLLYLDKVESSSFHHFNLNNKYKAIKKKVVGIFSFVHQTYLKMSKH